MTRCGDLDAALVSALSRSLGAGLVDARPLAGGDIAQVSRVALDDGREVVVKTQRDVAPGLFGAEAAGLDWLRVPDGPRIPEVWAASDTPGAAFLCLEWLPPAPRARDFDEGFGRGLASLHRAGARAFGGVADNFLAGIPQSNRDTPDWATFYGKARLVPLLSRARPALGERVAARVEAVVDALSALVGPDEPPARLHGDLWSGNVLVGPGGAAALIDPAVYGGHREIDLAMLRLFGAPSARFFAAYDEVWPRAPGAEGRVPLMQLYPLLVHAALFGAGYARQVGAAADAALRGG